MPPTCQKNGLLMAGPHKMHLTCHKNAGKMAGPLGKTPRLPRIGHSWADDALMPKALLSAYVGPKNGSDIPVVHETLQMVLFLSQADY